VRVLLGALVLVAALTAGAAVQWWLSGGAGEGLAPPEDGPFPRPAFTLPDLDSGAPRAIGEWDGKRVVLNFWASWCAPCLEEIPAFVRLQDRYRAQGVQFVGVAVDTPENARRLAAKLSVNYPNLVGELEAMAVAEAYGNGRGVLPYTALIGADGRVELVKAGVLETAELEAWFAR
jgi:thiol-disulfide isomerase/thioredoxin